MTNPLPPTETYRARTRGAPGDAAEARPSARTRALFRGPGAPRDRAWRLVPIVVAVLTVAAYVAIGVAAPDLPAAEFRTWLFSHEGFTLWNGQWYGGHGVPGYSVLFPPLAALLGGPEVVGALAVIALATLFEPLAHRRFGARAARVGSIWFAVGCGTLLFTSRLPWALGAAFGLAALLAAERLALVAAAALAAASALSSPVAGAFMAMVGAAYFLAGHRRAGAVLAGSAALPLLALFVVFPEGGRQPFVLGSFLPIPLLAAGFVACVPREERGLRIGAGLYALVAVAAYLVDTPFGGNAVRLGELAGGPLLACAAIASPARHTALRAGTVALAVVLAVWQWEPAVSDLRKTVDDPSTRAAYFAPVLAFLDRDVRGPVRVEIPPLRSHWESYYVARRFPLARGWQRQLDTERNPLFYGRRLTAKAYRDWLSGNGVGYVALPDARLEYAAQREAGLVARGLPYLREVSRPRHWRIYRVTAPHPLVVPEGAARIDLRRLGIRSLTLAVLEPGRAVVKVRWSPWWRTRDGCVARAGDWTLVSASRPGPLTLTTSFAPGRIRSDGPRCG